MSFHYIVWYCMSLYCIVFFAWYRTVMYRCYSAPANYRVVHLVIFIYTSSLQLIHSALQTMLVIFLMLLIVTLFKFFFFNKLFKVWVKSLNGSQHIGASSFSIYLGAKSEDLHRSPLFVWAAISSFAPYLSALALYKFLKAR